MHYFFAWILFKLMSGSMLLGGINDSRWDIQLGSQVGCTIPT